MRGLKSIITRFSSKKADDRYFRFTIEEMVNLHERNLSLKKQLGGDFVNDGIINYKKSNKLFILGSGPSINEINTEQWDEISKHDSFGFNFSFLHDFVPTFYFLQFEYADHLNEAILRALVDKRAHYSKIPIVLRGSVLADKNFILSQKHLEKLKEFKVHYLNEYPIHSQIEIEIDTILRYLFHLEMLSFNRLSKFTPKLRTTLNLLLVLAYQMGYTEIILCGMDMNSGTAHFWDDAQFKAVLEKYRLEELGSTNKDFDHFTSKGFSKNTVPEYVLALRDWMKEKSNVEVTVINSSTVLYPELAVYRSH